MQSVITLTRMPQDIFSFTKAQMGTGNTGTYVLANNASTSGPADTCASTSTVLVLELDLVVLVLMLLMANINTEVLLILLLLFLVYYRYL